MDDNGKKMAPPEDQQTAYERHFNEVDDENMTVEQQPESRFISGVTAEPAALSALNVLLSPIDTTRSRRAKILECCISPTQKSPTMDAANYTLQYSSFNQALEALNREEGFKMELAKQQSISDPFQFPNRPIEQRVLLNEEVEMEREFNRKHGGSLLGEPMGHDEEQAYCFQELDDIARKPAPGYQRVSMTGENVSGVSRPFVVKGV